LLPVFDVSQGDSFVPVVVNSWRAQHALCKFRTMMEHVYKWRTMPNLYDLRMLRGGTLLLPLAIHLWILFLLRSSRHLMSSLDVDVDALGLRESE